jgi:hypothetical protein
METGDGWLVTEICLGPLEWLHPVSSIVILDSQKQEMVGWLGYLSTFCFKGRHGSQADQGHG